MPKVLLVDVDSKIPNLALMKLSTHYKKLGYQVDLERIGLSYYPEELSCKHMVFADGYEKVFVSIIFTTNKDALQIFGGKEVIYGGSGYDLTVKLQQEIDDCEEDYSIYPDNDTSYGFITRGCIRKCEFCFVPKKEGMIHRYRTVDQIVKHKKVKFMDNNIFAFPGCEEILQELVDKKIRCEFNQGLDIRLIDERRAELLSKMNYMDRPTFAFDDIKLKTIIEEKMCILKKFFPEWGLRFFIYCNANTPLHDVVDRLEWCKTNKVYPYLMRDINCYSDKNKEFYIDLACHSNQPGIFRSMTFFDYLVKKGLKKERQEKHRQLYEQAIGI